GGRAWSGWQVVPGDRRTDHSAGLACFQDDLYVFITESGTDRILVAVRTPDEDWTDWMEIPGAGTTDRAVVPATAGGQLSLFAKGVQDLAPYINVASPTGTWSRWESLPNGGTTNTHYAAAVRYGSEVWLFGTGVEDRQLYFRRTT